MSASVQMAVFASIVDSGSFAAAAVSLGMSRAAVSRHMSALEARLGVRLMHRTTRRMSLTDEGKTFYQQTKSILNAIEDAESTLSQHTHTATGRLRVSVPLSFGIQHLAPCGQILCAAPAYLAQHGTPTQLQDLTRYSVVAHTLWNHTETWHGQGANGPESVRIQPRLCSSNGDTCRSVALQGGGILLQPGFAVGDDLKTGRLVELLPQYQFSDLGVYISYPAQRPLPRKVRDMVDYLTQALPQTY